MPVRMCMVCRKRAEKSELIRAVLSRGEAVVDRTGKAQKRGFYVCPGCLEGMRKKRVLERITGRRVEPEAYERFISDAAEPN